MKLRGGTVGYSKKDRKTFALAGGRRLSTANLIQKTWRLLNVVSCGRSCPIRAGRHFSAKSRTPARNRHPAS